MKLHRLHDLLRDAGKEIRRPQRSLPRRDTPLYFLPDWDDFIDPDFDYEKDKFSAEN